KENRALRVRLAEAERALAAMHSAVQQHAEELRLAQAHEHELRTLHQISELALREQPLPTQLDEAVQLVSASTGFPIVAIEYYDEAQQLMTFAAATGMPTTPTSLRVPVAETLSGLVARSGQPLIERTAQGRPEYAAAALRQLGVQTFVCVPMIVHARVIGTLALAHPDAVPVAPQRLPWMGSLANIIAVMVDRAHATAEVQAAVRQLHAILDKLVAGVLLIDSAGRCTYANGRAARMFGRTPAEVIGHSISDLLPPEVAQTYLERNRHFIATQGFAEYEDTFTLPVGTRTFFIVDQVLTNAQGEGEALLTSSIDITERKRTEAALQVALTKYRTLFDAFPLGITVSDATGKIVETNTMAERLLGLGRAEQRQRAIDGIEWQIVRPDGTPMPAEEYASVRALREQCLVENVEMGIRIPRGATTWINVTAAPLPLDDYSVVIAYSDITARVRAEAALRESQQNLESLIENTDGSIWSVDTQYRLIVGNRLYHRNISAVLGRSLASGESVLVPAFPQAILDEWHTYYDRAIHDGPFTVEASTRFTATPHTTEYRLSPITSATGLVMGVTVFGRDITARKQAEADLRALLHEKEVLLKEIHHRVKNNLQVVVSLLRLQSRQVTDTQAVAALRDSRQRVEVMALVHELLYRTGDLAAIDAALYFRQLGTRITQVYAATTDNITLSVVAEGIGLSLNQAVPCGLIVSELIANSLKYAFPEGQPGVIGVDLRATSPERLTLTVWDTGVGIIPGADETRPQSLGMTLVHDLVRQLRGTAVIASGPGVTVTITFPLDVASSQAATTP
ncbi:MAG: PAS domain S-box protein, partial [Chloroflexales bacterium]